MPGSQRRCPLGADLEDHLEVWTRLDLGGQWLDTASCYAFWLSDTGLGGQSETVIGDWLARRGVRDKVLLSTKVGAEPTRLGGFPAHAEGLAPQVVRDRLQGSLQRLQTDRVDLYWAHMEDRSRPVPEVADTFADLVAEGLTSRIGLSNHPTWFAAAAKVHARLEALRTWSRELGVRPSQLVIALLVAQEPSIRPIVGVSSVAQVRDAVEAARLSLPEEALTALNAVG